MCDMKIGGALVSAYLQNAKNREPPRFIGICSVDLSPERVVQIMRAKPGGNVVAKLVRQEGFETHWLLIAE